MLVARRFRGQNDIVGATSLGDGATSTGSFHEALNLASVERLPLVVSVANNQFAYSTPVSRQFACKQLADRAPGYGVEAQTVDGTDLEACLRTFDRAVSRARQGRGPQLVVGEFLRLSGHGEHDDASYIPESLRKSPLGRDCLELARGRIIDEAWATPAEMQAWEEAAVEQVQVAVATAQKEPAPDPFQEKWRAISSQWLVEPSE
jgi:pyruvate dehydrogenase E1 component alpha subunit/2-oxoisovalerate dehydrogenase E1 component alpha subunit